jgi:predicted phage-related endonuclease
VIVESHKHFTIDYPADMPVEDWLDLRAPYYNASMAAALFGEHKWETLGDVCVGKLTGKRVEVTEAMDRGTAMEPYILAIAADVLSLKLIRPPVLYGYGPLLATCDAIVEDDPDTVVEAKSTTEWIGANLPRSWYWQVISQMGCKGASRAYVAYLDSSLKVQYFEVEFNERDFNRVVKRAADVMACIALGEVPGGVDLSARNVIDLHPTDDGEAVTLPDDAHVLEVILAYQEASEQVKLAEDEKRKARDQLVSWLGPHSVGIAAGMDLYSFKQPKATNRFNMGRFAAEHPDLIVEYMELMPNSRTINIKKGNVKKATEKVWPQREEIL